MLKQPQFESSVISFGSKTYRVVILADCSFESSVISFGSKTAYRRGIEF